jgi:hypothetical protein
MQKKQPSLAVSRKKLASQTSSAMGTLSRIVMSVVGGVLFLLLIAGLLIGFFSLSKNADLRRRADTSSNGAQVSFQSSTINDQDLQIDVMINTQGNALAAFDIEGDLTTATPDTVKIVDGTFLSVDTVDKKLTQTNQGTRFRIVKFASLSASAQTSTHDQTVALFSFVVSKPQNNQVYINIDGGASSVSLVNLGSGNTQLPGSQTLTVQTQADINNSKKTCNQNCATDTECQSGMQCYKGACRAPANLEDSACTSLTSNQGLNRSCNDYCADSTECSSSYTCYFNRCRNPLNTGSDSCANPTSPTPAPVKRTATTTTTKKITPTPTPNTVVVLPNGAVLTIDGQQVNPDGSMANPTPTPSEDLFPSPSILPNVSSPTPTPTPTPTPAAVVQSPQKKGNLFSTIFIVVGVAIGLGVIYLGLKRMRG